MIEGQDLQSGRKARSWGHTTIGVGTQFKHLHQKLGPLLIVAKKLCQFYKMKEIGNQNEEGFSLQYPQ
jgi:hypothetical protein